MVALHGSGSNSAAGSVGSRSAGKPGLTRPLTPLFSPSLKAMILGLHSPAATMIRIEDPLPGEPVQDLGPLGGVKGVGLEKMAQGPLSSDTQVSPVGSGDIF
ncbi:hypothetical protein L1987_50945 [Smallanthus sonchifolius]|uniref:Uncharacterized protein n=1 Tax=Smallanthus sonchifolius TaxID=185202 RepID=A0ACB9ENX5_9ASTR|nr:hypothetical protein L1987_50945 [Smallanthus sonchifolius]